MAFYTCNEEWRAGPFCASDRSQLQPEMIVDGLQNWHRRRRGSRQGSVDARVIRNFNCTFVGNKPRLTVEVERARMIKCACMHENALGLMRPGDLERAIHQEAAGSSSDET